MPLSNSLTNPHDRYATRIATRRRIVRETKTAQYLRCAGIRWRDTRSYLSGNGIDVWADHVGRASHIGYADAASHADR